MLAWSKNLLEAAQKKRPSHERHLDEIEAAKTEAYRQGVHDERMRQSEISAFYRDRNRDGRQPRHNMLEIRMALNEHSTLGSVPLEVLDVADGEEAVVAVSRLLLMQITSARLKEKKP